MTRCISATYILPYTLYVEDTTGGREDRPLQIGPRASRPVNRHASSVGMRSKEQQWQLDTGIWYYTRSRSDLDSLTVSKGSIEQHPHASVLSVLSLLVLTLTNRGQQQPHGLSPSPSVVMNPRRISLGGIDFGIGRGINTQKI